MKRHQDLIESEDLSNKKMKKTTITDEIINNPGLQHIIELIFFNLDHKDLMNCQLVNKSTKQILENPMFWLKKWSFNLGLSKENQTDWIKAVQMTKNTNLETKVIRCIQQNIIIGHFVDGDTPIHHAAREGHLDVIKFLAPLIENPNAPNIYGDTPIHEAASFGHLDVIRFLAPLTENPNKPNKNGITPINVAMKKNYIWIDFFLVLNGMERTV